ncbi:hypothetical protein PHISCL_05030 [Aspergillus sclerotialis]|uniref:Uncharacterized protein n=1 Tax=Aspergillus sclerotialis TaxID=2070753 RepID=A0A3A2ZMN0_9EURO|nr:hypothetical protein PHISCL_05030 [Aspergillus sclerotialis]
MASDFPSSKRYSVAERYRSSVKEVDLDRNQEPREFLGYSWRPVIVLNSTILNDADWDNGLEWLEIIAWGFQSAGAEGKPSPKLVRLVTGKHILPHNLRPRNLQADLDALSTPICFVNLKGKGFWTLNNSFE